MVKVIIGNKGTGKTKMLIELVNESAKKDSCTVCIEKGKKLTYEISHNVRLIDSLEFSIDCYENIYGLLCGVIASNYDVKDIFLDSIIKMANSNDYDAMAILLAKMENVCKDHEINFVVTVSADISEVPEGVAKFVGK